MKHFSAVLMIVSAVLPATAQTLTQRIDKKIDAAGLDRNLWGIAVTDLQGNILYSRNATRLFQPASNTKLAVATAALSLLGPGFTTNTSVYSSGAISNGTLTGDLVLYGRGDPGFSRRCYDVDSTRVGACERDAAQHFADLARQLAARGIRNITGDLIADGTWFDAQRVHPTWENYDLGWYFAAPVSGLAFNDNAIVITRAGSSIGSKPVADVNQSNGASFLMNAVTGSATSAKTYDIFRSADGQSYNAVGSLPLGTSSTEYPSVIDPDMAAGVAFRRELLKAGITLTGNVRPGIDSTFTQIARRTQPLAEIRSRPLSELLFPILNSSQNLFAEMLLKQLGRQVSGEGSWRAGVAAETRFLVDSVHIDASQISLADASGLSHKDFVTPAAFTGMLRYLWTHSNRSIVLRTLPQSGSTGTLFHRLTGPGLVGKVHAKSGASGGINSLSGYLERADGKVLVFSIIANNHTIGSTRMIAAIDGIVVELGR